MADNTPSLDDLLRSIQEEDDDNIPGLDDLLESIKNEDAPQSSSALAVVPKKPEDLVEEDIDSVILSILGLEDVFDLTYEEYASLLKEASVKGRMPGSQMSTESVELVTEEFKRVKNKTGRFKVKPKKVNIDKVFNRKTPSPSSAIVKAQKLIPSAAESLQEPEAKPAVSTENLQEDLVNGIGNILESLITIRTLLSSQSKADQKAAQDDRKETEKKKKKQREDTLEKKKPVSPILKSLTKPVDDFFGAIKNFFTNVLLGSVVLGLFRWLKDPKNQQAIDGFANFLQNNAGLILGGLLAIAALPLAPMLFGLTGTVLGGLGTLTKALGGLGGLLLKIPGLGAAAPVAGAIALSGAAAVGVTLAMKGTYDFIRGQIAGGEDFAKVDEQLRNKLAGYGITETGMTYKKGSRKQQKLSESQQKIYDEIQGKRSDLRKLKEERDAKIREIELNPKYYTQKSPRSARVLSKEGEKKIQEIRQSYNQKALKIFQPEQPTVQPSTPLMPGLPPSAAQPGIGPAGNQVGSGSATFGETGNVSNAPGFVHGHFQTNTGTANDLVNDTAPIVKGLLDSGVTPELSKGQKFTPGMSMDEIKKLIRVGITQHGHSGDGRSVDIFVPKGTKVPFPLADVRNTGGRGGVTGILPGSGKVWVGHLAPTSKSGMVHTPVGETAQVAQTPVSTPSIPSPTGRGNIVPLPIPTGGGTQQASSGTAPNQAPVPRFSSEDPNNTTTMVVRAIYNIVG